MPSRSVISKYLAVGAVGVVGALAVVYRTPLMRMLSLTTDTVDRSAEMTGFAQGLSTDGCHRDQIPLASGSSDLRQFVGADANCPAEVALFGIDRSATLLEPAWTSGGDPVQASAGTPRLLEVVVHVATLPLATSEETDAVCQRAEADAARANELFNTMRCGFNVTAQVHTIDATQAATVLYADCNDADALRSSPDYQPGKLNAYYIVGRGGDKGEWCGNDVLIVSSVSDNETLAHEIGHGLSLEHFPLATENIMVSGTSIRNEFTLGQCYRCNFNPASHATPTNESPAPTNCPADNRDERCPEVWWPFALGPAPPPPPPPSGESPSPPAPDAAATVRAWLECEECTDKELVPVVALGDRAIPLLRQELDAPPDHVRQHLQATYQRLKPYSDARKITFRVSQNAYVSGYLANRSARLQLRAVIAAARIQTPPARQLVVEVLGKSRSDVQQYMRRFVR